MLLPRSVIFHRDGRQGRSSRMLMVDVIRLLRLRARCVMALQPLGNRTITLISVLDLGTLFGHTTFLTLLFALSELVLPSRARCHFGRE